MKGKFFPLLCSLLLVFGFSEVAFGQSPSLTSEQQEAMKTIESLSEKYGVEVDTQVQENPSLSTNKREFSEGELEEIFKFFSEVKKNETVFTVDETYSGDSNDNFSTQDISGTATASAVYDLGGEFNNQLITRNISFAYTASESNVGGLPQWLTISDVSSFRSGLAAIDWIEQSTNSSIINPITVELAASGYWEVVGEFAGIDIGFTQADDWVLQYSSRNIR